MADRREASTKQSAVVCNLLTFILFFFRLERSDAAPNRFLRFSFLFLSKIDPRQSNLPLETGRKREEASGMNILLSQMVK